MDSKVKIYLIFIYIIKQDIQVKIYLLFIYIIKQVIHISIYVAYSRPTAEPIGLKFLWTLIGDVGEGVL